MKDNIIEITQEDLELYVAGKSTPGTKKTRTCALIYACLLALTKASQKQPVTSDYPLIAHMVRREAQSLYFGTALTEIDVESAIRHVQDHVSKSLAFLERFQDPKTRAEMFQDQTPILIATAAQELEIAMSKDFGSPLTSENINEKLNNLPLNAQYSFTPAEKEEIIRQFFEARSANEAVKNPVS